MIDEESPDSSATTNANAGALNAEEESETKSTSAPIGIPAGYLTWLRAMRDSTEVTRTRLLVLMALGTFMDAKTGRGFASVRQVADATGLSEGTVQEHVSGARDAGWLVRVRRGSGNSKTASTHQLTTPAKSAQSGKAKSAQSGKIKSAQPDNEDTLSSGKSGAMSAQSGELCLPSRGPCDPSVFRNPSGGTQTSGDDAPSASAGAPAFSADKASRAAAVELVIESAKCSREVAEAWVIERVGRAAGDVINETAYIQSILATGQRPIVDEQSPRPRPTIDQQIESVKAGRTNKIIFDARGGN